jgi:hypothetical protein
MGNLGAYNRDESFDDLGAGQHIIADNVFESNAPYGGCAIRSAVGSTQVIIANNLFVNFGSSAVEASGRSDPTHYASANTIITGNIFDMTEIGEKSAPRTAIDASASDAIISDNQIYVRGAPDSAVTAVKIAEPAVNISVHDNLIRNCGAGILTRRAASRVGEVIDGATFAPAFAASPVDHRRERQCEGWCLVWLSGGRPSEVSALDAVIGAAKPETVQFKLKEPRAMKAGDAFETIPPSANWTIHNNTITGCARPVVLDSYGSQTSFFKENLVSRGDATGVKTAIEVRGQFKLIGNHISGFDESGSAALLLGPDPIGRVCQNTYQGNIFERCSSVAAESQKGLWDAATVADNLFLECGTVPPTGQRSAR